MNRQTPQPWRDDQFWSKLKTHALKAGREVIFQALKLYYALQSTKTPKWAKTVIIGALGYFIAPIDALPDFLPMVGFTDDLSLLAAAVATVAAYIDEDVKEKASKKLSQWFGSDDS